MLSIKVVNPNYEETYTTRELSISDWYNFLHNHTMGNLSIITFTDSNNRSVTINPTNYSSVIVTEGISDEYNDHDDTRGDYMITYSQTHLGNRLVDKIIKSNATVEEVRESVRIISSDPLVDEIRYMRVDDLDADYEGE